MSPRYRRPTPEPPRSHNSSSEPTPSTSGNSVYSQLQQQMKEEFAKIQASLDGKMAVSNMNGAETILVALKSFFACKICLDMPDPEPLPYFLVCCGQIGGCSSCFTEYIARSDEPIAACPLCKQPLATKVIHGAESLLSILHQPVNERQED